MEYHLSVGGLPPFFKPDDFSGPNNTNEPFLDFLSYALDSDQDSFAQVLSTSYGDDEQTVRFTVSLG
jgi:tripeptidyl-peptidase I